MNNYRSETPSVFGSGQDPVVGGAATVPIPSVFGSGRDPVVSGAVTVPTPSVFGSGRDPVVSGAATVPTPSGVPVRVSRTTRPAVVLCVLGLVGIAWGSYHFLASIDVFGVVFSDAPLIRLGDAAIATLSTLLVLVALLLSIRGVLVSRPRRVPVMVLVAALLLPAPVALGSLAWGGLVLKDRTIDRAWDYVGRIEPQDVDAVYDQLAEWGVNAPGREEVRRILSMISKAAPEG